MSSCAGDSFVDSKMEEIAGDYTILSAAIGGHLIDVYSLAEAGRHARLYKEKGGWFFEFRLPASVSDGEVRLRSCKQEITYEPLLGDYLFVLPTEGDFMGYDTGAKKVVIKGNQAASWRKE